RPRDWLETFGNIYRDHAEAYRVDLSTHYMLPDNLTGENRDILLSESRKTIVPREPDPIEIMRGQYGGIEQDDE
ncbi:hypothetical protein, partial [Eubacterium aggregans]|uniref:hypothetical protein n=1 Tax=Eubacterium aggregans TaxID=81409 RepID=UPI003F337160